MKLAILVVLVAASATGCTTFMSWLSGLPPVTEERCKSFDPFQFGLADGETAQRPGEKFEFWDKDCRQMGVKMSRPEYDRGYEIGLKNYCSCERGFEAGAKDEILGLKAQYMICKRAEFKYFEAGFNAGSGQKIPPEQIPSRAIDHCAKAQISSPSLAR